MENQVPNVDRRDAGFHSSVWEDYFLNPAYSIGENIHEEEVQKLKANVRDLLLASSSHDDVRVSDKLELIEQIQQLAISYHFEHEIDQILNNVYMEYNGGEDDDSLHETSLQFRLLRQQGYKISCDVFDKFKDSQGKFNESVMGGDVKGLLSLYEASHMRIHGEDILDEALRFTVTHLQSLLDNGNLDPSAAAEVKQALKWSLRKGLPRLSAWHYIHIFQADEASRWNQLVLELAKLDFNLLQKQHQKEIHEITRWWKDLDVPKNFSFARDRVTEFYFWILGVYFESEYSVARCMMAKLFGLASILDDIYDSYGTTDELELLTNAIDVWDISAMKNLPEYMQVYYKIFLDIYKEIEEKLADQGRSYRFFYAKQAMKVQSSSYLKEAQWFHQNYIPTMDEYMLLGQKTSGYELITVTAHLGMGDVASVEAFDWLVSNPKIMRASNILARLLNDIGSHKFEQKRGHVSSAVECYMNEYHLSEQEALESVRKQIDDAWKDINEECLYPTAAPLPIITRILNLSRVLEVTYQDDKDAYSNSKEEMKEYIQLLLVNSISCVI